jgi:hypothetical protein
MLLALGGWWLAESDTSGQPAATPDANADTTVLARGPVHEAFAEPVTDRPRPSPIVPKKPPDPIEEVPPDQKPEGSNVLWIPGYWAWDDEAADFLWVSGFWRNFPPGRQWVPGYWQEAEGGYQWVPGYWADESQPEQQYLPTPPPTIDAGPSTPAPGDDSTYVPGCWIWRETRYFWRPGFWHRCYEGYVWVPACYRWTPFGCVFIDGHWDFALRFRGVLFAPVVFANRVYTQPNFVYTPSYVVYNTALVNALFVRASYGHYYFGDYFDPSYQQHGFVPWIDYRIGRAAVDPLYSYYRWHYREYDWDKPLRTLYAERRSGEAPRPPHTLVQQNTVVQNLQNTNVSNVKNVLRTVTMVAPVNKVDPSIIKLQTVPKQQLAEERKAAEQVRALARERQKVEHQLAGKEGAKQAEVRTAKLALPKAPTAAKAAKEPAPGLKAPPPAPKLPQHEERAAPKHEPEKPLVLPKEPRQVPKQPEPKGLQKQPAPAPKAEPKQQPEPKAEPKKEPAPKAEPKTAPKQPEPKAEPKKEPAPKAEPKKEPTPKVEPKKEPAPKAEPKQPQPPPKPEPKQPPELAPHPAPHPAPQPAPHPAPQPAPQATPHPGPPPPHPPAKGKDGKE